MWPVAERTLDHRILVSRTPGQTRVAVLQDDRLTDYYADRDHAPSLAGAIYAGRVSRVFAKGRRAIVDAGPVIGEVFVNRQPDMPWPAEGARVPVQIVRDPDHGKRAIGRFQPVLVGRYVTATVDPPVSCIVSESLDASITVQDLIVNLGAGWQARSRLKKQPDLLPHARREAQALAQKCESVSNAVDGSGIGDCLSPALSGIDVALRESPVHEPDIVADKAGVARSVEHAVALGGAPAAIALWPPHRGDLFETEGVTAQLDDALARQATHNGATITIDPTEALTAIDVDVAVPAGPGTAIRQSAILDHILGRVRLLNIGGLIAIDLPGGGGPEREALIATANKARAADPLPLQFEPPGRFNVMLFSRQQVRCSLLGQFFNHETMAQRAMSDDTVALEALAAASRLIRSHPAPRYRLTVAAPGAKKTPTNVRPAWLSAIEDPVARMELLVDPALPIGGQQFSVEAA